MMITSVKRNKKNKDRLSVFVDDEFAFSISEDDYLSLNLYEKSEIAEETIEYIKNTVNFNEAKARAVRYLSLQIRTEKEVRDKLESEGYNRECISRVIDELKAIGYINNELYAQKYVYDRSKLSPMSKRMMKLKLMSKASRKKRPTRCWPTGRQKIRMWQETWSEKNSANTI